MRNGEADFIMIVSSDLIAEVMQKYFDKLYKEKVQIVDLNPASDGYSFSIAFVKPPETVNGSSQHAYRAPDNDGEPLVPPQQEVVYTVYVDGQNGRDSKGRFTRVAKGKDHGTASQAESQ